MEMKITVSTYNVIYGEVCVILIQRGLNLIFLENVVNDI